MLEISTPVPSVAPGIAGLAPSSAGAGAPPDGFAQALADAAAGAAPPSPRQEFAAPGKIAFAALPVVIDPAAPPPADFAPALDALPAEVRLGPPEATRKEVDDVVQPSDPQAVALPAVVLTLALPVPVIDVAAASLAPGTTPGLGTAVSLAFVAAGPAASAAGQAPQALASAADSGAPSPLPHLIAATVPPAPAPALARRLSLQLDRSVEVLAGGSAPLRSGATGGSVERVARHFAAPGGALAVPLAPQTVTDFIAPASRIAAQVFASALAAPARQPGAPLGDVAPGADGISAADAVLASAAPAIADQRPLVTAPRPLDTLREDWPQRLIDRVEAARDAANAADTRIRLVPEALGKIDIALRQEGSTLHVHFTAEQAATRDLLNDAQPRLAELAAARGLQLGQAGVGTGAQGGGRRPPVAAGVRANAPASDSGAEAPTGSDDRIA